VIARLPNGTWSAPSAIGTFGAGLGGQIGVEVTDFVFILNDNDAVKTFAQTGSVTLGGNVSVAAGPVGRNAEAAGAASLRSVAGIFSYSKTKGLFAGVSLEGSAIIERRDANEQLYGRRYRASELLTGAVNPPPEAAPLMAVLSSPAFGGGVPSVDANSPGPRRQDNAWGAPQQQQQQQQSSGVYGDGYGDASTAAKKPAPPRPTGPKPPLTKRPEKAVALFTFDADQVGDLGFKKGDIITVIKKTENATDWW